MKTALPLSPASYRPLGKTGRSVSPVGFGCYRVHDQVETHHAALRQALLSGVNLVDTSTNYADGFSERLVGRTLRELSEAGALRREDVVVVTKAGYVQGSNQEEALRRIGAGRPWSEMVEYSPDCWHAVSPDFLEDQLTASLDRLGMRSVDVLLLHNPEYFLMDQEHRGADVEEARERFYDRARRAFLHLEGEVDAGRVGAYGVSSNTFVVPREKADAVDLTRLLALAGPGFKVIQLPFNPIELGAREPIHTEDGRSVLEVARAAGLGVLVNRPLNAFGKDGLVRFAKIDWRNAPNRLLTPQYLDGLSRAEEKRLADLGAHLSRVFGDDATAAPGGLDASLSQRTIRALAETVGVDVVLVGMRTPEYVQDAIGAFAESLTTN